MQYVQVVLGAFADGDGGGGGGDICTDQPQEANRCVYILNTLIP